MRIEGNILFIGKKTYKIDKLTKAEKVKFGLIKATEKEVKKKEVAKKKGDKEGE
jgi:hypothetical protein